MNSNNYRPEPEKAPPSATPAARGFHALGRLINVVLFGLVLASCSITSLQAQNDKPGIFENLPALPTNTVAGTLGDIDALNGKLDEAIAKSTASIDAYGAAINDAGANFSQAAANRVDEAEMECLRTCAEGLRLFVANAPKAAALHQTITGKGDKIAAMMGSRITTRINAAKQLAQARHLPIEVIEVELSPSEMADLREWSLVSEEVRLTEGGNRLHLDRLQGIMDGVARDRAKLAADGISLAASVAKMEMLRRVVQRFADDANHEQKFRQESIEFRQQTDQFGQVADRYRRFVKLGERSIQPRADGGAATQNIQLGGPVK